MKKITCTVTNDLTYDQRMKRICTSLANAGYDVTLIGREKRKSLPLTQQPYKQHRIKCRFEKGKLFYAEYNYKLWRYLLKSEADIFNAIDLDTMLPNLYAANKKNKPLVYDAHEYFTEMEEVVSRPMVKKVWQWIERKTVPKAKAAYTVSDGYADLFQAKYNMPFETVRNATVLSDFSKKQESNYILYQGAVNVGRGLHELIYAMQEVNYPLYICGKGDVFDELKKLTTTLKLDDKVTFYGYVSPEKLREYTLNASIGITLFSNAGLSNQYSLANRFFDYMHAGVPQLAMDYPEYRNFNQEYKVAELLPELSPNSIAEALNKLLKGFYLYDKLKQNALSARQVYNWQNEEKKLLSVYENLNQ